MTFRTFTHDGIRDLVVEGMGSGSLTLEESPAALVDGSLNADPELLDAVAVRQDGGTLRIEFPRSVLGPDNAHLRLAVPPTGLGLRARTGSASVTARVPLGRCQVRTGSGDVDLGQVVDLEVSTGSGEVRVGAARGTRARISSGSGEVTVDAAYCPVRARSGSGPLTVSALHRADLQAASGSGDITVPQTSGSVDLRSASGSITVGVAESLAAWLDLQSVSGPVRIALETTAPPAPGEPYVSVRARTASGEVLVFRA